MTSLQRTHQTAAPLAARLGLELVEEPDLREVFLGDWEGGELRVRAAAGDPIFRQIWEQERWDVIPGAESSQDVFDERVWRGFQRIVEAHPDERVMAVAHGGVIGQLLHRVTGSRRFAFSGADNASISEVVAHPERIVLRRYNDVSHLLAAAQRLTRAHASEHRSSVDIAIARMRGGSSICTPPIARAVDGVGGMHAAQRRRDAFEIVERTDSAAAPCAGPTRDVPRRRGCRHRRAR